MWTRTAAERRPRGKHAIDDCFCRVRNAEHAVRGAQEHRARARHDHERRRCRRGAVQARRCRGRPAPAIRPAAATDSAALPPDAGAEADARFEHQRRAVAPDRELERQVPRRRQWRLGGRDAGLRRHAGSAAARLRHGRHRHRALGRRRTGRHVCAGTPGEDRRLRLSCAARHDGEVQAAHRRVLCRAARLLVLQRLLDRRPAGRDGRAALSR